MSLPPFHLAFPVDDLAAARALLWRAARLPRRTQRGQWIDFDLFGHQIVAHLAPDAARARASNAVDGEEVPVPHFGVVLPMAEWRRLPGGWRRRASNS